MKLNVRAISSLVMLV